MILLTRLGGPIFALNQDLIERADCTPDTVLTLVDGTKYVISESLDDVVELIRRYRASVIAEAQQLDRQTLARPTPPLPRSQPPTASVVPLHRRQPLPRQEP